MLEGELQAREIVIAVSKSEQIKKLLNPLKWPVTSSGFRSTNNINASSSSSIDLTPDQTIKYTADPISALSRDSFAVYEPSFDHSTTLSLYNLKMFHLENLINNQNRLKSKLIEQLKTVETQYEQALNELEEERLKNKQLEAEFQEYDRVKLEEEIKTLTKTMEENKNREKQIVLNLLTERKHLIIKLIEEKQQNEELNQTLSSEKGKVADMVEGLEDESKRSLQMEAELEKFVTDFEKERINLNAQLQLSESKNNELLSENERLKCTIDSLQKQLALLGKNTADFDDGKWNIGEGVRSSIVTMPVNAKAHSMSSVTPVAHPKASVAQPVTKSIPNNNSIKVAGQENVESKMNIILPPPSIPVPVPKQSTATIKKAPTSIVTTTAASTDSFFVAKSNPVESAAAPPIVTAAEPPTPPPTEPVKAPPEVGKSDNSVKQTVKFYENSVNQNKAPQSVTTAATTTSNNSATSQVTSTIRKSSGGRVPPPIPPNKPSIKPVLPTQAILQSKIKDVSTKPNSIATKTPFNMHIQNTSASNTKT